MKCSRPIFLFPFSLFRSFPYFLFVFHVSYLFGYVLFQNRDYAHILVYLKFIVVILKEQVSVSLCPVTLRSCKCTLLPCHIKHIADYLKNKNLSCCTTEGKR